MHRYDGNRARAKRDQDAEDIPAAGQNTETPRVRREATAHMRRKEIGDADREGEPIATRGSVGFVRKS